MEEAVPAFTSSHRTALHFIHFQIVLLTKHMRVNNLLGYVKEEQLGIEHVTVSHESIVQAIKLPFHTKGMFGNCCIACIILMSYRSAYLY